MHWNVSRKVAEDGWGKGTILEFSRFVELSRPDMAPPNAWHLSPPRLD
jgi:hypothetical protein